MRVAALALLAVLAACATPPASVGIQAAAIAGDVGKAQLAPIRRDNKLSTLSPDGRLGQAALDQAQLMASAGRMSHTVRVGQDFGRRMDRRDIGGPAAENIARGHFTSEKLFELWMASPPHRRNMLDDRFTRFGLAYATDAKGERWWALVLAK